jgi:hypothetical protein
VICPLRLASLLFASRCFRLRDCCILLAVYLFPMARVRTDVFSRLQQISIVGSSPHFSSTCSTSGFLSPMCSSFLNGSCSDYALTRTAYNDLYWNLPTSGWYASQTNVYGAFTYGKASQTGSSIEHEGKAERLPTTRPELTF